LTPISPSKALCRLLFDSSNYEKNNGVAPELALRSTVARSLYALSQWKAGNYSIGDGVAVSTHSRRFLESSTTGLLLRVDPLRVLALRELQRGGAYQLSRRNLLAVQWSGDVISKLNGENHEASNVALKDCDPNKLDRALFSSLCSSVIWKSALEKLQTYLAENNSGSPWQLELLNIEPDEFSRKIAGQLNGSFSFFSKGVHSEWVDRRRSILTKTDCRTYAGSAIKQIMFSAAALCCSPTLRQRYEPTVIINCLDAIESEFGQF
jgi:hypothetical protein